jgi:hypothetical protein
MKAITQWVVVWLATFLFSPACEAYDAVYFNRIVSTQQTVIVSIDASGIMVWSNAVPGASCRIEHSTNLKTWTEYFPTNGIQTNGPYSSAWIPSIGRGTNYYRYIVGFQPTVTPEEAGAILDAEGLQWELLAWDMIHAAVLYVPVGKSLTDLQANPAVKYVEVDEVIYLFGSVRPPHHATFAMWNGGAAIPARMVLPPVLDGPHEYLSRQSCGAEQYSRLDDPSSQAPSGNEIANKIIAANAGWPLQFHIRGSRC